MALPSPLIPIHLELTPAEVAARCAHLRGMVFFDAAIPPPPLFPGPDPRGPLSLVAAEPVALLRGRTEREWERLREALARRRQPGWEGDIPPGIAAGWVEYDGSFLFAFYERLLAYRHPRRPGEPGQWYSLGGLEEAMAATPPADGPVRLPPFRHEMTRGEFMERVRRVQEAIARGDIYQVNLTHRLSAPWAGGGEAAPVFRLYERLRQVSPAPYAAYLALEGRTVLSSSPELFLAISGGRICTRPIKGTRPRFADAAADARSARELRESPKENAELIMITDLERNDLGRVCRYGSVAVREMLQLEAYEQVFHLVSTVEGRLRPEVDPVTALRACFPGGSITGAPKKRAMEIIAELESVPRGLYTGSVGYFGFNSEARFNIVIRTLILEKGEAHFHVGAGIVTDSDPAHEWNETLHKAAGILRATGNLPSGGSGRDRGEH